jgi:hypothetical protein
MPIQGLVEPMGPRPLGRDTATTVEHWPAISAAMPIAPTVMRGPLPRQSPPIWRFVNPRKHAQVIGMCVGRSGTRMPELLLRIPESADEAAGPLPAVDLSSLYTYWIARARSRALGVRLGADGAIVSHSIQACAQLGYVALGQWPDDAAHERVYSDAHAPSQTMQDYGRHHPVKTYAILDSLSKHYEYMSQGYPIQTGMEITEGWQQTDEAGRFRNAGSVLGGHATCAIGYDIDQGWVAILNSWERWGRRSTEAMFAATDGYTNIGYMQMEDYNSHFTDEKIRTGISEAVVATKLGGFDRPLVAFDWTKLYTSGFPA